MATSKKVIVLGAGKIGRLVTHLLAGSGDYEVTVADVSLEIANKVLLSSSGERSQIKHAVACDFSKRESLVAAIKGHDYAVSCAPFYCNKLIAQICLENKVHYLDLTEDVATTKVIRGLAEGSSTCFIPQCGLAPGFISIVANDLATHFTTLENVKMRVGALPMFPHNRLKYNMTWSTEGLINEYCNPCEAVVNGEFSTLAPLEGLETFSLDGQEYEAFNTSGGLGTLAETLCKKVTNLDYKSIRYPGHREIMALLLHDLKMNEDRDALGKIFEKSLPHTFQDVVIVFVTVSGIKKGRYSQESYAKKIYNLEIEGEHWGAIQITTAAGICAVLDLHAQGELQRSGFVRQEDVSLPLFLNNRFGKYYR